MPKDKLSKYVNSILESVPEARTNDGLLFWYIVDGFTDMRERMRQHAAPWDLIRLSFERRDLPSMESISRARRHWQMEQKK